MHHIVSLYLICLFVAYKFANNLSANLLIVLLEAPTPLINLTRIHDYMYPKNPVVTTVTHAVYGAFRLVGVPILMCMHPWTVDEIDGVVYFVYFLFTMLTVASYKWFREMTMKPRHAEACMTM